MSFNRLEADDFVVSAQAQTATCWTTNTPTLSTFFTQSNQVNGNSGRYYVTVFDQNPTGSVAAAQFEIAYGNSTGGGALAYNQTAAPGVSPASTIYGQYRTLVLEDENSQFEFGTYTGSSIYVLSIERAAYKESLFPGSLNLTLSSSINGNANKLLRLTDNSGMVSVPTYYGTQRAYQVISGSDGKSYNSGSGGSGYTTLNGSYGLFLPDIGTVILNGDALDLDSEEGLNLSTNTSENTNGDNPLRLLGTVQSGSSFKLNSEETITSDYVFIRARNSEFNYSENPSYISGSTGEVVYNYFINNPQTYITTVGMYNDSNELLATAKLSRPLNKNFTKEALIRVKLDF
ncbi:MAG: hypothetical protein L7S72_11550 [Flavobacteriales bacterium]|nr:hypothetical protein [Flavobacteriales bacterium]